MNNDNAYFDKAEIDQIIGYYIKKRDECKLNKDGFGYIQAYKSALLFYTLYRTGRRISEILGKSPYEYGNAKYPGLRLGDINADLMKIKYGILKKSPIKREYRNKMGKHKIRNDEEITLLHADKEPKYVSIGADKQLITKLLAFVDENNRVFDLLYNHTKKKPKRISEIDEGRRLFNFSRVQAHKILKEACDRLNIIRPTKTLTYSYKLPGSTIMREKTVKRGGVHCHMCRHSFAIYVLKNKSQDPSALPRLQQLMQHSDLSITQSYLKFNQEENAKFLDEVWNDGN